MREGTGWPSRVSLQIEEECHLTASVQCTGMWRTYRLSLASGSCPSTKPPSAHQSNFKLTPLARPPNCMWATFKSKHHQGNKMRVVVIGVGQQVEVRQRGRTSTRKTEKQVGRLCEETEQEDLLTTSEGSVCPGYEKLHLTSLEGGSLAVRSSRAVRW